MRFAMRVLAAIIGIVGAVVALIVNVVYSGMSDLLNGFGHSNGFIGILLVLLVVIGAIMAIWAPVTGALLLLIAAVGFMVILHWAAFVASPLPLLAALLAYMDRKKEQPKSA